MSFTDEEIVIAAALGLAMLGTMRKATALFPETMQELPKRSSAEIWANYEALGSPHSGSNVVLASHPPEMVEVVRSGGYVRPLLEIIAKAESRGYETVYGGSKIRTPKPLTAMTVNEVIDYQTRSIRAGSASSACGRYQIIKKTLIGLKSSMRLSGNELYDANLQDAMALKLAEQRGLSSYLKGKKTLNSFGNSLAKEWAGLPVLSGAKAGQSYYGGDGLNQANVSVREFASALQQMVA